MNFNFYYSQLRPYYMIISTPFYHDDKKIERSTLNVTQMDSLHFLLY